MTIDSMKKIIIILAALLAVSAVSCKKEIELPEGGPAVFFAATRTKADLGTLAPGASATVKLYATTYDTGVREQLTATFAPIMEDASQYLAGGYELLPANCYEFTKNDVVIDRYNKDSRTGIVTVTCQSNLGSGKKYALPVALVKVNGSENASADPLTVVIIKMKTN